jgi:hypothetical protein
MTWRFVLPRRRSVNGRRLSPRVPGESRHGMEGGLPERALIADEFDRQDHDHDRDDHHLGALRNEQHVRANVNSRTPGDGCRRGWVMWSAMTGEHQWTAW